MNKKTLLHKKFEAQKKHENLRIGEYHSDLSCPVCGQRAIMEYANVTIFRSAKSGHICVNCGRIS